MAKFRATLRVLDLNADDPASAQRALEEKLKQAGLARHRVLSIEDENVARRRRVRRPQPIVPARSPVPRSDAGGLLLVTAIAWVVFMFYYYVLE